MPRKSHLDPEYFWSFVAKGDGCWEWTGHRNARGYGHISVLQKLVLTHRHAWMLTNGPIPDGQFVLHRCDNPPCVRPDHLYLGTSGDNVRDRQSRGRSADMRGEKHGRAKLTGDQVITIRSLHSAGNGHSAIARQYGVTPQLIYRIVTRRAWRHI